MPRPRTYCTIEGCDRPNVGRGWCRMHYERWKRRGDPNFVYRQPAPVRTLVCKIDGCGRPQKAHGWCQLHYRRYQRSGDPLRVQRVRRAGTPLQRWWARVSLDGPNGCWIWTGALDLHGYGAFPYASGRYTKAHRWGYKQLVGDVSDTLDMDHLCRTPACVRPDHLEPVSHTENVRRGVAARRSG